VRAALDAADAGHLVRDAVQSREMAAVLRAAAAVDAVAVGKAAAPMLQAFLDGALASVRYARAVGGAHPIPDERSVEAARQALAMASGVREQDLLVVLLSGGASSLMALPAEGLSLAHKQQTAQLLLSHGAEIHHLAAVRKHLSGVKGGQLATAASGSVLTLAVSDVVGDDLSAIGGGPTVADDTTFAAALGVLDAYGGREAYPHAVVARLTRGAEGRIRETPKPGDPSLARSAAHVIGGRVSALDGARRAAESLGYAVHVVTEPTVGEARHAGARLVKVATDTSVASGFSRKEPRCILAAGETTVRVTGRGKGGRNQECALAMLSALYSAGRNVVAASVGTDGIDGPTDAAGAVVDTTTAARAAAATLVPEHYLNDNNAYAFFDHLGDLIRTGPTTTNVGDLQVILISD
jgi:hydroxypyruvate reductase